MARTKESFDEELENILNIHFDAKYYFRDVKYLNNPDTTTEKEIAVNALFIRRIRIAFWRLGVIEIAKLFQKSKNQHYNLANYLEELIRNYDEYGWIKEIPLDMLNNWLSQLNSQQVKNVIDRLCIQRDNFFAHTDKNPRIKLENAQLTFEEVEDLINLTESIIYDLKACCFKTHSDFEITGLDNAGNILEAYVALKEKRERDIKQEWDEFRRERG